ncbi:MAG: M3 family oligoendopeptidase [Hallerella porci]|uniref:Oligoendopeptidase F n=1 Tax=Hallerella porci TaxID=1945871 RepID=A0ABX5LMX6_9BACT|nr:M3 family oligoendopeptidase [Hallerella porci]MDY3921039.1 M3 family oligoendopeptidase [Hallerella porci]PWL03790.1 oligoendopeptidase F [Hallerella porci]
MIRNFIPADFKSDDPKQVTEYYEKLVREIIPENAKALRDWILKWNELTTVLSEESAHRYVAMTSHTQDESIAKAYMDFVENIDPICEDYNNKLERKMIAHPNVTDLESEFGVYFRDVRTSLELFNKENIPLFTQESTEIQSYQKITSTMSVEYHGETKTLQQMAKLLSEPDRNVREDAWRKIASRRLQDKERLDEAFDKLFKLRIQISKNSGFYNYLDYIFKAKSRFDYSPENCQTFHESIEKIVLPYLADLYREKAKTMKLERLRPWDTNVDALSRPPLKPFQNGEELIEKVGTIFDKLSPQTGAWFRTMQKEHLIDPDSRMGKAPGGYQIGFEESGRPFIFMNAAGTDGDIYTLLHESGHSFQQFSVADIPLTAYHDIPSEFAEVSSMSMELIGSTDLSPFYPNEEDAKRSRASELEEIIWLFPWVASVDSFQHLLYTHPNHTAADRKEMWLSVMDRYDAGIDYSGFEDERAYLWQKQLHIFEVPFYYIEYGIAQLGALQVWENFKKNPAKGLSDLFAAEALGSSRPLPELFARAGIRFDFSPATIEPLMRDLSDELTRLKR